MDRRTPHRRTAAPGVIARAHGTQLVRRTTAWVAFSAAGATAVFAGLAGAASHAAVHHRTAPATATSTGSSTVTGEETGGDDGGGGALSGPSVAPQQTQQAPVVVSGGS